MAAANEGVAVTPTAALSLICLGLCALWPLIALTNYVATTWRYGMNERRRLQRERAEREENARIDALMKEGMRKLYSARQRERDEALKQALDRPRNVIQFRRKV